MPRHAGRRQEPGEIAGCVKIELVVWLQTGSREWRALASQVLGVAEFVRGGILCRGRRSRCSSGEVQQSEQGGHPSNENKTSLKHDALLFDADQRNTDKRREGLKVPSAKADCAENQDFSYLQSRFVLLKMGRGPAYRWLCFCPAIGRDGGFRSLHTPGGAPNSATNHRVNELSCEYPSISAMRVKEWE